jgi:serine/threonine-protein kinase
VDDSEDERPTVALRLGSNHDFDGTVTLVDDRLPPGTDVGGYVIDGELGHGGMGVVYSATHPVIGKRAAIKVLKPDLSRNRDAVERFALEARAVNQIGHPNIVDIFAFGALPDGRSYYVMDLLAGESLRARLKRGPLHISEAASVIDESASALIAAHSKGIIHRDLKPDNVFVVTMPGRWPEVKLLDWGLAKLAPQMGGKARTLAGDVMGTPVYMSPEQARASNAVDHRTDIYALGVMSYEILAGKVPFKGQSSIDTLLAHQDEPVPSLLKKVPTLPEELAQLIEAMLAKEPDGRPTLAAVRTVLKRLKGSQIPTMTAAGLQVTPEVTTPAFEIGDPSRSAITVNMSSPNMLTTQDKPTQPRMRTPVPQTMSDDVRQHLAAISGQFPLPPPDPSSPSLPPPPHQYTMTTPGYSMPPSMYPQGSLAPQQSQYPQMGMRASTGAPAPHARSINWMVIAIAAVIASVIGIVIALAV